MQNDQELFWKEWSEKGACNNLNEARERARRVCWGNTSHRGRSVCDMFRKQRGGQCGSSRVSKGMASGGPVMGYRGGP